MPQDDFAVDQNGGNTEETGPFGDTDGSRADIHDLLQGFVGFSGSAAYGSLRVGNHELRARVVVGGKGAGKSVYLRRLQADAVKRSGVYSERTPVYADTIQRDVPKTESVVRICHWYPEDFLTETWKWLWRRAIMRSLVSHLLCAKELNTHLPEEARKELEEDYKDLYRTFRKPVSVYSQLRNIISTAKSKRELSSYLDDPQWDELEVTVRESLRECPPICFYIDAVDDEFAHAPMYWLVCQKGLFYEVMRLLREDHLGGRLHVMICVRDSVFSSVLRSEHGGRYRESPYIRLLDWSLDALQYFLRAKLETLPKRFFPHGEERTTANWLGLEKVATNREVPLEEPVEEYILRHIRPLPRDIVILGNRLCRALDQARANGEEGLSIEAIAEVVSETAKKCGDEQLTICANQISADMMPAHAYQHRYGEVYTGANAYAPVVSQHLKEFLHDHVGRDRFDNGYCRKVAALGGKEFAANSDVLSVLWQNGLIGYGDGDIHGQDVIFYRMDDKSDELVLPMDRDFYVLHSCLIDSAGIEPVGPPVFPYRRPRRSAAAGQTS